LARGCTAELYVLAAAATGAERATLTAVSPSFARRSELCVSSNDKPPARVPYGVSVSPTRNPRREATATATSGHASADAAVRDRLTRFAHAVST
jgi:hypothetical protein